MSAIVPDGQRPSPLTVAGARSHERSHRPWRRATVMALLGALSAASCTNAPAASAPAPAAKPTGAASRPAPAAKPTAQPAAASRQLDAALRRLRGQTYTSTAMQSFTLRDGRAPDPRLAPWQRLFPARELARETVGGSARVITDTSSNGTVQYLIAPPSVLIVRDGRRQRASGAQLTAIGDALTAHADFLSRLPSAGTWQVLSAPGSRVRDLHVYPAAPSLAADLLPGFVRHPGAVEGAKLGIDVYLDSNGALMGTRVALSCLVDLSAIATRPNPRPAWIGVALRSTTRVTAAAGSVARR